MTATRDDAVTALVLSLAEPTTARARASLDRQTVRPSAIEGVRGVAPFHRALNQGVARVRTPFLVQVDADMILDPTCIEDLRALLLAVPDAGAAIGFLRDPLVGRVSGIKLFRRACFDRVAFPDSITPDTDFLEAIRAEGWRDVYGLRFQGPPARWHTWGEHQPVYTPSYAWAKHLLEGARYRYRRDPDGLRWHIGALAASPHPGAIFARIGLAVGVFTPATEDRLVPFGDVPGLHALQAFLRSDAPFGPRPLVPPLVSSFDARRIFLRYRRLGAAQRRARAGRRFVRLLETLGSRADPLAWVAQLGLCRGVVAGTEDGDDGGAADAAFVGAFVAGPRIHSLARRRLSIALGRRPPR